jgi:hypothetical protein
MGYPLDFRLAGGSIDGSARFVTDVFVIAGNIALTTRLPVRIPAELRPAANAICSLLTAVGYGVFSIDRDGVPEVYAKSLLFEPHAAAVAAMVDLIRHHRSTIDGVISPAFVRLVHGESVESIAQELKAPDRIPLAEPISFAAAFDRSSMPDPSAEHVQVWREGLSDQRETTEAEAVALATLWEMSVALPEEAPICAGPVVVHADGTIECFGCETPNSSYHPKGSSASCRRGFRPGSGHACQRCAP